MNGTNKEDNQKEQTKETNKQKEQAGNQLNTTRNQINDTFLSQNRVKVKVVGEVSEK